MTSRVPPSNHRRLTIALILTLALNGPWLGRAIANEAPKHDKAADAAKPEKAPEGGKPEKGGAPAAPGQSVSIGMYYDVPELAVNLKTAGRAPVFLKAKLSLQMGKEGDRKALDAIIPQIIDGFQNYLREVSPEDMRGSMGIYKLREELLLRASTIATPIEIKDVLFKEMLMR